MSKQPTSPKYQSTPFNLTEIKEFHHGLIYGFDPEKAPQNYDPITIESAFHKIGQFQDMFDAYYYAQNTILSTIRTDGIAAVSIEQLLAWINQIHLRIANTLAGSHQTSAGKYTNKQLTRWQPTADMMQIACLYILKAVETQTLLAEAKELGANPKVIKDFFRLLDKVDNTSISLTHEQKSSIQTTEPFQVKTEELFLKLSTLFHNNKLSPKELAILNQVVVICLPPNQLTGKMEAFAKELLIKWQSCDASDIDQVANLVFFAFFNLTEIHPYFNCNGRTATCLINIILRSLNQPSILMRLPGEKQNSNSVYSKAIGKIREQPELLVNHIKFRLKESGTYHDDLLAKIISKRIAIVHKLEELASHFPPTELQKKWSDIITQDSLTTEMKQVFNFLKQEPKEKKEISSFLILHNSILAEHGKPTLDLFISEVMNRQLELVCVERSLTCLNKLLKQVTEAKQTPRSAAASISTTILPAVVKYQYNSKEKKLIITKLVSLTGLISWKTFNDKGSTAVLLTMELEQKPLANQIVLALQKTESLQAKLMKEPGSGKPVIKLTAIEMHKLLAVETLSELNSGAAVEKLTADVDSLSFK